MFYQPYRASRELTKGNFAKKRSSRKTTWRLTAQEKIKRPVDDKERFVRKEAAAASWEEYRDWKRTSVEVNLKNGAIVSITWDDKEEEGGSSSSYDQRDSSGVQGH